MKKITRVIALLSDLGVRDFFVGAMKGEILKRNPHATIVDITHELPKFDRWTAAFTLLQAAKSFPPGTIFVVVVDPGVGSCRKCLLVETRNGHYYIAPDNGVLSLVIKEFGKKSVREIRNRALMAPVISHTFHGRDIMAPVAAHLSLGLRPEEVGPEIDEIELLPVKRARKEKNRIVGRVVHIDDFGNVVTNIPSEMVEFNPGEHIKIQVGGKEIKALFGLTFCDVPLGDYVCFIGSAGLVELSKNQMSAASDLNVKVGDEFVLVGV
jgi:hypothetical protein